MSQDQGSSAKRKPKVIEEQTEKPKKTRKAEKSGKTVAVDNKTIIDSVRETITDASEFHQFSTQQYGTSSMYQPVSNPVSKHKLKKIEDTFSGMLTDPSKLAVAMYDEPDITDTHSYKRLGIVGSNMRIPKPDTSPENIEKERRKVERSKRAILGTNDPTMVEEPSNPHKNDAFFYMGTRQHFNNNPVMMKFYEAWVKLLSPWTSTADNLKNTIPVIKRGYIEKNLVEADPNDENDQCLNGSSCQFAMICRKYAHPRNLYGVKVGKAFKIFFHDINHVSSDFLDEVPMINTGVCVMCIISFVNMIYMRTETDTFSCLKGEQNELMNDLKNIMVNPFQVMKNTLGEFDETAILVLAPGGKANIFGCFPMYVESQFRPYSNPDDDLARLKWDTPVFCRRGITVPAPSS